MPHITQKMEAGPLTFDVGTNTVVGGQLVMSMTGGFIAPTTSATTKCLGVALDDAKPLAGQAVDGTVGVQGGGGVTSAIVRSTTAVASEGVYRLTYSVAAAFGDLLVADTAGKVKPYTAGTTTFDQIVGRCVEPLGVLINARGRTRLELF